MNSTLRSWIAGADESDFPIQNLPLGIFSIHQDRKVCTRIGNQIVDLSLLHANKLLDGLDISIDVLNSEVLNSLIAIGKNKTRALRQRLVELLELNTSSNKDHIASCMHPIDKVKLHIPFRIGDYTDFYSSKEHATNVGIMFRDPANALLPN
ncbi:MAG: fumarylacetoacetase, partial [Saprospiraceae bacterium]